MAKKIDLLTVHLYIAKSQARYLSVLKENLLSSTSIVLADFAEIYSMVVQDAVQGWHWTKQQCTIHPLVLYYKNAQEKLAVQSMVFFSNDLEHDTGFAYQLQKLLCNYIRLLYPHTSYIQYFSDGNDWYYRSAQYKNYKIS